MSARLEPTPDELVIINAELDGSLNQDRLHVLSSREAFETYRAMKRVLNAAGWRIVPEDDVYGTTDLPAHGQPW